jgi:hypothetical protein
VFYKKKYISVIMIKNVNEKKEVSVDDTFSWFDFCPFTIFISCLFFFGWNEGAKSQKKKLRSYTNISRHGSPTYVVKKYTLKFFGKSPKYECQSALLWANALIPLVGESGEAQEKYYGPMLQDHKRGRHHISPQNLEALG